jgi:hypothetical protein
MIFRIVFGFAGAGQGWAETHAMLNATNNPKDLIPTLTDIANKRAQMLGREFSIVAIRASRYATDGGVRTRGSFISKVSIKNALNTISVAAEPADVALIVRGAAEPNVLLPQFDSNTNQTFLGAPLDISVDNAGVVDRGKGGLEAAFGTWRTAMLNTTIGWLANQIIGDVDLVSATQNINGTVELTTTANLLAFATVGTLYKVRVRQVNEGASPLNGSLTVRVTSATTMTTKQVIGLALVQTGGAIKFYKPVQPFVDYGDLTLNQVVGNHKRGRPFGSTPGRAKKRIRG